MKEQMELQKEFREKQEKYAYYLIALCVASIGFAVVRSEGMNLKLSLMPLGLAVSAWAFSIYFGFEFLGSMISSIYRNSIYLDIIQGRDQLTKNNPDLIKMGIEAYQSGSEELSKKSLHQYRLQNWLFYLGMILFIGWHVLEMFLSKN